MSIPLYYERKLLERYALSDFLLYRAYEAERGIFELADGRLGMMWLAAPLPGISVQDLGLLHGIFEQNYPPGTTLQVQHLASRFIEPIVDDYVDLRPDPGKISATTNARLGLFRAMVERERAFLLHGRDTELIPSTRMRPRTHQIVLSMTVPLAGAQVHGVGEELAVDYLQSVESVLQTVWQKWLRRADLRTFRRVLFELLNPGHSYRELGEDYDRFTPLNEQLVAYDSATIVRDGMLEIDGQYVKSLTVRMFPHEWHGIRNRELIGNENRVADQIRCPFLLSLNCLWLDPDRTKAAITQKHVVISNQARAGLLNIIPQLQRKKEQFDLMQQALADGYRPMGLYYHLLVYDRNPEDVERRAQEIKGLYMQQNWEVQDDPYIDLSMFLNSLPMHMANDERELRERLRRMKTVPTSVAPHLMPIFGDWRGFGEPVVMAVTRCGQVFAFDVFGNTNGGYSITISGKTGSGKSFFTNKLMLSYLSIGSRIWVIDSGRSYEKLCRTIGGQYIDLKAEAERICFNPFSLLSYKAEHEREEQGQLLAIFERMCAPRERLSDLQRSWLQEVLMTVWREYQREGTPELVAQKLAAHHDPRARDLAQMLSAYRAQGLYGSLFNGQSTLNFTDAFVVMEMEGFEATPELANVLLLQLILAVQSQIVTLDRAVRKLCVIDEAWRHLVGTGNDRTVSDFFVLGARAFRKHRGAIVTVTQGVNDYFADGNRSGEAIWENSDFTVLFNQKPESLSSLRQQKRLILSEAEFARLESVHRQGDEYAECMLLSGMGNETLQIVVDEFTRYLFTTKPEDLARLNHLMQQDGYSLAEAINRCIEEDRAAHLGQ